VLFSSSSLLCPTPLPPRHLPSDRADKLSSAKPQQQSASIGRLTLIVINLITHSTWAKPLDDPHVGSSRIDHQLEAANRIENAIKRNISTGAWNSAESLSDEKENKATRMDMD